MDNTSKLETADYRKNPESKESHLEFYWIPINGMDRHNLLPQPMRKIIENYINDIEGPYFESTFEEV
ncbi:hypothetical protein D3C81_2261360 [compost metagenome]